MKFRLLLKPSCAIRSRIFYCVKLRFSRFQIFSQFSTISMISRRKRLTYWLKCTLNNIGNIRVRHASPSANLNSESQNELFFETTIREFFKVLRRIVLLRFHLAPMVVTFCSSVPMAQYECKLVDFLGQPQIYRLKVSVTDKVVKYVSLANTYCNTIRIDFQGSTYCKKEFSCAQKLCALYNQIFYLHVLFF